MKGKTTEVFDVIDNADALLLEVFDGLMSASTSLRIADDDPMMPLYRYLFDAGYIEGLRDWCGDVVAILSVTERGIDHLNQIRSRDADKPKPGPTSGLDNLNIEVGVRKLIEQADSLNNEESVESKQTAVEKLWDAFERIKTLISNDKKSSANALIQLMSDDNEEFNLLIASEFKELSEIGNKYRIRHHEIDRVELNNPLHLEYLFNRCRALLTLAVCSLNQVYSSDAEKK